MRDGQLTQSQTLHVPVACQQMTTLRESLECFILVDMLLMTTIIIITRSSATTELAHHVEDVDFSVDNVHSKSLKVIRCCANRQGIYDFLLALNSNLTSIFNLSRNITPNLHIHIPLLFQEELEKDGWE